MRSQIKRIMFALGFSVVLPLSSVQAFIVKRIEVIGAQRMTPSAVRALVPIHLGQHLNSVGTAHIIQKLYTRGYFSKVSLGRRGRSLVVNVQERPTIGLLSLKGNSAITNKQLKPVFKKLDIIEGSVYSPEHLNDLKTGLVQGYQNLGYYAAKVTIKVKSEPYNQSLCILTLLRAPLPK